MVAEVVFVELLIELGCEAMQDNLAIVLRRHNYFLDHELIITVKTGSQVIGAGFMLSQLIDAPRHLDQLVADLGAFGRRHCTLSLMQMLPPEELSNSRTVSSGFEAIRGAGCCLEYAAVEVVSAIGEHYRLICELRHYHSGIEDSGV